MITIDCSSLIPDLPNFLTWTAGDDLIVSASYIYTHHVYRRLRVWSDYSGSDLYDTVLRLPKSNQRRLVYAPELYYLLQSTSEPGVNELELAGKFIQAEQYLCGQSQEYPGDWWAALGDCYFPPALPELDEPPASSDGSWPPNHILQAPKLRHIVLDGLSPAAVVGHPTVYGEITRYTLEEIEAAGPRIAQSLEYIDSISQTARLTIDSSVQVLRLVKSQFYKSNSMSRRQMIGAMTIYNSHLDRWTIKRIMDALVHEAIHSLIYKLQLADSLYTDELAAIQLSTVSPWSGRTLLLHSYVHACFVWYGLWRFWSLCPASDDEAAEYREKARSGFLAGSPLLNISSDAYDAIQPVAREAINQMYAQAAGAGA